jgi:hypothetical protein
MSDDCRDVALHYSKPALRKNRSKIPHALRIDNLRVARLAALLYTPENQSKSEKLIIIKGAQTHEELRESDDCGRCGDDCAGGGSDDFAWAGDWASSERGSQAGGDFQAIEPYSGAERKASADPGGGCAKAESDQGKYIAHEFAETAAASGHQASDPQIHSILTPPQYEQWQAIRKQQLEEMMGKK